MTGQGLVDVIKRFGFEDKVGIVFFSSLIQLCFDTDSQLGWMVGDNVTVNDGAIRYVCKILDPLVRRLDPRPVSPV
jgi:hypothetical protein